MYVTILPAITIGAQRRPQVSFSLSESRPVCGRTEADIPYVSLLAQLRRICEAFLTDHWPCQTKANTLTSFSRLYMHIQTRISQLGNFCVVCGRQQELTGLKPVPCRLEACNLAFDEDGIGADLRDIYSRPVVADLLLTMASSAASMTDRRDSLFKCIPSKFYLTSTPGSRQIDWHRMVEAFAIIPNVVILATIQDLQQYFIGVSSHAGLRAFRLLRSVLNSCWGHLTELQGEELFPMMNTEYQFRLCTDSPLKEEVFSRRKEKYGSRFLFHGSPLYNWHCILREGLKNLSGSSLMSTGASQGPGIYLAEDSSTSATHCRQPYAQKIIHSIFDTYLSCIALCEVINHSCNDMTDPYRGVQSSIRVVPDANNVIIRYLFVYHHSAGFDCQLPIPGIKASSLEEICNRHARIQADIMQKIKRERHQLL